MPILNELSASINPDNFVIVRQYKFDTIRQEAYWSTVNKLCRQFKTRVLAEEYVKRIVVDK